MRHVWMAALALVLVSSSAGTTGAQDRGGRGGDNAKDNAKKVISLTLQVVDEDGDGKVSKAELLAAFAALDKSKDGLLDAEEIKATPKKDGQGGRGR